MASYSQISSLLLVLLLLPYACVSSSSGSGGRPPLFPKVALDLYYDSLDMASANFLIRFLPYIYENDLIDMVNLKLVPYAQARIQGKSVVVCKRGSEDCLISRVAICSMKYLHQDEAMELIYCISHFITKSIAKNWEMCFELMRLEEKRVKECFTGYEGKQLDYQYVKEISNVIHGVGHLPWITIDQVQVKNQEMKSLKTSICKAYKGDKSEVCGEKIGHPKTSGSRSAGGHGALGRHI
ncbi:hypothetical protein C5167_021662 [Papaver somniferum]|uniref:gamma-interferon-responsive lysosomal thiol protein-like n=1 Tax=Papaver somniferum TaxID=3469 RepID=UPI000E6FA7C7|nr:gamma-interferon-responsive lysosomal thiol protein-like [Papaver somniferum]RZC91953.1 hypothetical protein C5167_021662 [Papaver somniferum]